MKKIFLAILACFLMANTAIAEPSLDLDSNRNPVIFDKNTSNETTKEPDLGPYMRDLQRKIKKNWEPPKGNKSKRVVVFFKINKDGSIKDLKIFKFSGISKVDKAAIKAVKRTAPFSPLPPEFKGNDIDIQFTFDYNVFDQTGKKR